MRFHYVFIGADPLVEHEYGVGPLCAEVTILRVNFLPPVAIQDLQVTQESLEDHSLVHACLEPVASHKLGKTFRLLLIFLCHVSNHHLLSLMPFAQVRPDCHVRVRFILDSILLLM